jgi:hypothetical protein
MKYVLFSILVFTGSMLGQSSACPAPTPGSPHVCLTITASTSTGVTGYNVYKSSTTGGENYAIPLNSTPISPTTLSYYDTTCALGSTCFYTATAIGTGGVLSPPSPEASAQVPVPPAAPGLKVGVD